MTSRPPRKIVNDKGEVVAWRDTQTGSYLIRMFGEMDPIRQTGMLCERYYSKNHGQHHIRFADFYRAIVELGWEDYIGIPKGRRDE